MFRLMADSLHGWSDSCHHQQQQESANPFIHAASHHSGEDPPYWVILGSPGQSSVLERSSCTVARTGSAVGPMDGSPRNATSASAIVVVCPRITLPCSDGSLRDVVTPVHCGPQGRTHALHLGLANAYV